jgi:hypothetical protein
MIITKKNIFFITKDLMACFQLRVVAISFKRPYLTQNCQLFSNHIFLLTAKKDSSFFSLFTHW